MQNAAQVFAERREELNTLFTVRIRFRDRLIGGIPAVDTSDEEGSKNLLRVWLTKNLADTRTEVEIEAEVEKTFAEAYSEAEEETTQTFKADETGLYIEGRQVKAMLKEAGGRLGFNKAVKGTRPSLRQDLHEAMHVDEDRIYLGIGMAGEGNHVVPQGYETRAIHVMGPQGPRNAIKRSAYVERAECQFTVRILDNVVLDEAHLIDILAFGQDLGLGADRSQGHGKFEVIGFDPI